MERDEINEMKKFSCQVVRVWFVSHCGSVYIIQSNIVNDKVCNPHHPTQVGFRHKIINLCRVSCKIVL